MMKRFNVFGDQVDRYQLAGPLRRRSGLATRWNAVMTAGISTGDKVIANITTGRSIVLPTYLPSAKRIAACFSEGRATPRDCHLVAVAIRSGLFGEAT
jgi:hypothetical protein